MDTRSEIKEQERTAIQEEWSPCFPLPLADLLPQAGNARCEGLVRDHRCIPLSCAADLLLLLTSLLNTFMVVGLLQKRLIFPRSQRSDGQKSPLFSGVPGNGGSQHSLFSELYSHILEKFVTNLAN